MEKSRTSVKRKKDQSDSSDSESEITFRKLPNVSKRTKVSTDTMGNEQNDFVKQITDHFDLRTIEIKNDLSRQLEPIKEQINSHASSIAKLNDAIQKLEASSSGKPEAGASIKEEKYWIARRSGRFWSITGSSESELKQAAVHFIYSALAVPQSEKIEDRISAVRRTRSTYSSKIKNEALVIFDTPSTRDFVFSHAKNLGKVEKAQRDNFGMRLDYPAHLGSDYRALDAYGAQLKNKFGDGFRRNVRFNDDELCLYMDIFVPQTKEWIKISAAIAKEERKMGNEITEEETKKKIRGLLERNANAMLTGANLTPLVPSTQNAAGGNIWGGLAAPRL